MKRELRIVIAADGTVTVKVTGASGASCLDATKFLEDAMGGGIKGQEMTEEFYQPTEAGSTIEQGS